MSKAPLTLRPFEATDVAWLVDRHAKLYAANDGFDETFGPLVQSILEAFIADHDPQRERGWIAQQNNTRLGSIFCVKHNTQTAKLRLFLLEPAARGQGLGQRLLDQCLSFAQDAGYNRLTLWTHKSHAAACALYAKNGLKCIAEKPVKSFGQDLVEQTWQIKFEAS